jgi:hypothetical protein
MGTSLPQPNTPKWGGAVKTALASGTLCETFRTQEQVKKSVKPDVGPMFRH